ncbi:hypothetical protein P3L10_017665 [Capsicum annuum]
MFREFFGTTSSYASREHSRELYCRFGLPPECGFPLFPLRQRLDRKKRRRRREKIRKKKGSFRRGGSRSVRDWFRQTESVDAGVPTTLWRSSGDVFRQPFSTSNCRNPA